MNQFQSKHQLAPALIMNIRHFDLTLVTPYLVIWLLIPSEVQGAADDTLVTSTNGSSATEERILTEAETAALSDEDRQVEADIQSLNNFLMQQIGDGSGGKGNRSSIYTPFIYGSELTAADLQRLPDLGILRQLFKLTGQTTKTHAMCHACKVGMGVFLLRARTWPVEDNLIQVTIFACTHFKIASHRTCEGLVRRFGPILLYIVSEIPTITEKMFCSIVFQAKGCAFVGPFADWNMLEEFPRILGSPPPLRHAPVPVNASLNKVIHLTDIHVDPFYSVGSSTDCQEELCCRAEGGVPDDVNLRAGYYGDYRNCDLPYHSFENALKHISVQHSDAKVMYLTGDMVPHDVWNTSAEVGMDVITTCSRMIKAYFPNIKVIPVLGNHDTHPVNLFSPINAPERFSTRWVYMEIAKLWTSLGWLPVGARGTFLYGGYYQIDINPSFKIVVLNTNLCYTFNFWLLYDHEDPAGQLRWLIGVLLEAERRGQKVHILGHVPPSQSDCWDTWSKNFYHIIARFSSVVTAQFYGHTHYDEFKLFYHPTHRSTPINPIWLGASLTPYNDLNPGYKIFYVDSARRAEATYKVVDHETWIYDLEEANDTPGIPPKWYLLYRASEAYDIPNVLSESLHRMVLRMAASDTDFDKYFQHYHKIAPPALRKGCDVVCKKRLLCDMVTPYLERQTECILLQSELDGVILPLSIFDTNIPGRKLRLT